ncbi:MAG: sigma-54 dependent transcriptional regulator [Proteobacteria bacterium]|nr:sigma-54 dependent transcriptional regulator [Pseudomonadota bacterium]MBU1641474.1 sigma-54 dependent transcriptional regulator [Pseudomonadota bacterium]
MRILIVDDEQLALSSLQRLLRRRGYRDVQTCEHAPVAVALIKEKNFDLVLLDLLMPEMDGLQVLEAVKAYAPRTEFIMLTAVDDVSTVVKALRLGAYDYLVKPVDHERLVLVLEHAFERLGLLAGQAGGSSGKKVELSVAFERILTRCPRVKEILAFAQTMAQSGNPVLITGESGTGKELLARAIHEAGPCPEGPYVAVNVASVSESLFESQFFGHVQGAFTGATRDYPGFFEQADGGTLFLDEIGELPLSLQAKFLRVLEEKRVNRLGDPKQIAVDVRIVSATNVDLEEACQLKRFRLDLLYRIKAIHLHLPPLRERDGDIPLLADHFFRAACLRHNKDLRGFGEGALEFLQAQEYPGNIRELAQRVENGVLLADGPHVLFAGEEGRGGARQSFARALRTLKEDADLHTAYVLSQTHGDRKRAAEILGVSVRQVQRKLVEMKKEPRWASLLNDI